MRLYDWVISDTHFFHENIIKYAGRPANHNDLMIENWKDVVRPEDTVLHLGDVLMGSAQRWQEIPRLPGRVHVLKSGNHDEPHKRKYLEEEWGWEFVAEFMVPYRGWSVSFTHEPLGELAPYNLNVHGHIHEKPDPSPQHINVSVEQIHYRPVYLRDLLDLRISKLEKEYENARLAASGN